MQNEKNLKGHSDRTDLVGEHIWGDAGQIILLVLFLIIWAADSFFFKYSTFLSEDISLYIRIPIAAALIIYAFVLARKGLNIVFGEVREKPEVIRDGVFGIVRHPVYLGAVLLYPGLIVSTCSIISAAFWLIIILFYHFIARYEEKVLLKTLGKDYEEYMQQVPMWIPKIYR